jgi:hypothetical protein
MEEVCPVSDKLLEDKDDMASADELDGVVC